ncbi:MAG: LysE family translocator [Paracoccus sp. (in: a-proteobacteria)]
MPDPASLLTFAAVLLGMVLTPGPNMVYLISRSICQGPKAGLVSLAGVAAGFVFYMICAACGITAVIMAVPYAYDVLRFAGAVYLLYLAWQAIRPGGRSPFHVHDMPKDGLRRLFMMGLLTNLLNLKVAVIYLSLLPQFVSLENGSLLGQLIILGSAQIMISLTVNAMIVMSAGSIALFLVQRPGWAIAQRWLMGAVLAVLALKMMTEGRR